MYEVINIKLSVVYWTKNPTKSWRKIHDFIFDHTGVGAGPASPALAGPFFSFSKY